MKVLLSMLHSSMRMSLWYYCVALTMGILLFLLLRKEQLGKRLSLSLLLPYLFLVLSSTVFKRKLRFSMLYRLELFHSYRIILQKGISRTRYRTSQVLLNIMMLSPIGFLMPVIMKRRRWITVLVGYLFSLLIEVLQLLLRRGCFDVDDLFNNTLGVALAYGCTELLQRISRKRKPI